MNSRNPVNPRMEIGSSSTQPPEIGSSSTQPPEIGSSSNQPTDIASSSTLRENIGSFSSLRVNPDSSERTLSMEFASLLQESKNSRNPVNPRVEIGSSSTQPTDIASSSNQQKETGSSSNQPPEIGSSSSTVQENVASSSSTLRENVASSSSLRVNVNSSRRTLSTEFASHSSLPELEETITDPVTNDTYVLNNEIGSFYNGRCRVYRAFYSKYMEKDGTLVPSGYVTLKIINMNLNENDFNELRHQGVTGIAYNPHSRVIGLNRNFGTLNLFCVSLPYMSEGSLRCILSTRPNKKLPEDFISVFLKEVLVGLRDELHVESNPRVHKTLNAGDIFVHIDDVTGEMLIKLAFEASVYDSGNTNSSSPFLDVKNISEWGAAPEVYGSSENEDNSGPKSDIWLLGITALELAYGNLPVKNRGDLNYIIKQIRAKKKFPKSLERLLIKRNWKLKKAMDFVKPKKRVFSKEFEKMVLACLSENPENRPTARQLLNTPFFTTATERFMKIVLEARN